MGKTSFALNIAAYAAIHKQIPVAVFSLEMSKEQLVSGFVDIFLGDAPACHIALRCLRSAHGFSTRDK